MIGVIIGATLGGITVLVVVTLLLSRYCKTRLKATQTEVKRLSAHTPDWQE